MVSQRSMEQEVHGTEDRLHTAATLGWLRAGHWTEIFPFLWRQRWWHFSSSSRYHKPAVFHADSPFIRALGTPAAQNAPPQTGTLAQRALEEWERTLCENKAVAILAQMQAGRPALIQKDGGEMLIAIVLDRPLADAKALVNDPAAFTREIRILRKSKTIHLLRKWSSQQEVVTHPPQTVQLVAPAAMNTSEPVSPYSSRVSYG